MGNHLDDQVRRVEVTDPVATERNYDYADAFEVDVSRPDPLPPETWVMAGLKDVPAWVEWVASLLRVRAWRVVESDVELVVLEQSLPLMLVTLVGRNLGSSRRRMTSVLRYRGPVAARVVWALVGIGHRRTVRRLLTRTASDETGV